MPRIGILCNAFVNTGTHGGPTWTEADLIGDLAVNPSWNEGESTVRRTRMVTNEPTTLVLDVTGKVRVPDFDETNVGFDSLEDSFLTNAIVDVLLLNGPIDQDGASGFRFDARVHNWSEDQALGAVLFKDFNLRPCASINTPKSVEIAGGIPVYTEIGQVPGS